jgi:hypothetical protein
MCGFYGAYMPVFAGFSPRIRRKKAILAPIPCLASRVFARKKTRTTSLADKEFSRKDFDPWVDIQPWIGPGHLKSEELSNDLQSMVVEPATGTVGKQAANAEAGGSNPNAIAVEEWEYWEHNKHPETRSEE